MTNWAALAAFVGVAAMSLAILWPQPWEFTANPQDIIKAYIDEPAPIDEIHQELSFHMNKTKSAAASFEPKRPSPMQPEMEGLSLREIASFWRSPLRRKSRRSS
jgi:hypothetical protein